MHSGWLVESASLWGYHGAMMAGTEQPLPVESVHAYWLRSRVRFDAWNGWMTKIQAGLESPLATRRAFAWCQASDLIEEILLAEPLSRICVAVAWRLEDRQIDSDSRAILHNVFCNHQEIRKRCMQRILEGIDAGVDAAHRLNRLRAYLEHWTDMLLGFFADPHAVEEYAFSTERVAEFAEEYSYRALGDASETVWALLLAGNRKWVSKHCCADPIHPKMGQDVCQAALGMVHPGWFDSLGILPSKAAQSLTSGLHYVDRTLESLVDGTWHQSSQIQSHRADRFTA